MGLVDKSLIALAMKMGLREGCGPGWTSFCVESVFCGKCLRENGWHRNFLENRGWK